MSDNNAQKPDNSADRDQQLEAVIADYIRACETGTAPNRSEIIKQHPELADQLRQFIGQHDRMNQIAAPIRGFGEALAQAVGPGQQLSYVGNYELLEEIARGGMGVVYKARQTTLGRIVAVKMIVSGRLASEQDVQRFQVEAQAAAGLQHPNIVSIHEVGQHEGWHYFSMDYVEGRDLSKILRENLLSAKQAATYVRQMAEAIHYAHQQGILHRDLKPSNILIDSHDQVRITDFGLAMRVEGGSDLTRTGQIVGTPSYMPPEQAQGNRSLIGPGSDVYSLGAILYECLTGRPPFRSESMIQTLEQVVHAEAVNLRSLNAAVPRDLETICLKCLEKEPNRRFETAQLLTDDLNRFLNGEPVQSRPISRPARASRWCRKHKAVAALMATVATCLVAGIAVSSYFAVREAEKLDQLKAEQKQSARLQIDVEDLGQRSRQLNESLAADGEKLRLGETKLYETYMQLARSAWRADNISLANHYLNECPPGLREVGWNDLKNKCLPQVHTFVDQRFLAFSADGKSMATFSGTDIKIWNMPSQELKCTLESNSTHVFDLNFDGSLLASGRYGHVDVWDVNRQIILRELEGDTFPITEIVFSPDSQRLAAASWLEPKYPKKGGGQLTVWEVPSFNLAFTLPGIEKVAFSHDSRWLASCYSSSGEYFRRVAVWDCLQPETAFFITDQSFRSNGLCFHPTKNELAISHSGVIEFWNMEGRKIRSQSTDDLSATQLAYSPDGKQFAYAGETAVFADRTRSYRVVTLDTATLEKESSRPWFTRPILQIAFSPDGKFLATADEKSVRFWDVAPTINPTTAILNNIVELNVGQLDWPQWGGSRARINTPAGKNIPTSWDVGKKLQRGLGVLAGHHRKLGQHPMGARNIKWAVPLGSESYGNPVVANGKLFVGTNNGAGYVDRYPYSIDLGVLLCFVG